LLANHRPPFELELQSCNLTDWNINLRGLEKAREDKNEEQPLTWFEGDARDEHVDRDALI
jgi:hypothetical protein